MTYTDGFHLVVKKDCETCQLIEPIIREAADQLPVTIYVQDDTGFLAGTPNRIDDDALAHSFYLEIETVPTIIRIDGGQEQERIIGWQRAQTLIVPPFERFQHLA